MRPPRAPPPACREGANEQLSLPGSAKGQTEPKSPMAAPGEQTALGELGQEATCPLCLDFFEQPMGLSCGHNFCRGCLAQLGAEFPCPQCRAKVEPGSACPSRALANVVCLVKRLRLSGGAQEESSRRQLCREHGQPLQSFCSSEKSLLCPGCLGGHQGHPLLALPEAAQEYKVGGGHPGASFAKGGSWAAPNGMGHSISSWGGRQRGPLKDPGKRILAAVRGPQRLPLKKWRRRARLFFGRERDGGWGRQTQLLASSWAPACPWAPQQDLSLSVAQGSLWPPSGWEHCHCGPRNGTLSSTRRTCWMASWSP